MTAPSATELPTAQPNVPANSRHPGPRAFPAAYSLAIPRIAAPADGHRDPVRRLKTVRRPPIYPNGAQAISPVAPSPLFRCPHAVHRCPSVDSGLVAERIEAERLAKELQMNYKETFKEAWQLTEEGMNSGMADWRFYSRCGHLHRRHSADPPVCLPVPGSAGALHRGPGPVGCFDRAGRSQREGAATGRSQREGAAILAVGHFRQLVLSPAGVKGNYPCSRLN